MKEPWKGAIQAGCLTGFLVISLFLMHASINEPEGIVYDPMEGRDATRLEKIREVASYVHPPH